MGELLAVAVTDERPPAKKLAMTAMGVKTAEHLQGRLPFVLFNRWSRIVALLTYFTMHASAPLSIERPHTVEEWSKIICLASEGSKGIVGLLEHHTQRCSALVLRPVWAAGWVSPGSTV